MQNYTSTYARFTSASSAKPGGSPVASKDTPLDFGAFKAFLETEMILRKTLGDVHTQMVFGFHADTKKAGSQQLEPSRREVEHESLLTDAGFWLSCS